MNWLQNCVLKLGTFKSVMIITILSVVISLGVTYLLIAVGFVAFEADLTDSLLIAAMVPMIVAPIVSFSLVSLLFKIYALEKQTRVLVQYDVLTGLLSRRAFYEQAEVELRIAAREGHKIAILVADIDSFKTINDNYGHDAGDQALKFIANVINQNIRSNDIVGRTGGDEFVFCLPAVSVEQALEFGDRLIKNLGASTFSYENNSIPLGLSLGVYSCEAQKNLDIDTIIKAADHALYRAKSSGKSQIAQ
jgi:diguanylate cyclase (GGDEF)-like protein